MNYTYEIKKILPKAEYLVVAYKCDGYPDFTRSYNPTDFSEEHITSIIHGGAAVAVEFWQRYDAHPEEVAIPTEGSGSYEPPVVREDIDPNYAPEIEPRPEYDLFTQRIEMNLIEDPMQATVGWTIYDMTAEERASTLEKFKSLYREKRNVLLSETDHWMMSDTPEPTQAQLDYRQALRDVPEQAEYPQNISWPTKPE